MKYVKLFEEFSKNQMIKAEEYMSKNNILSDLYSRKPGKLINKSFQSNNPEEARLYFDMWANSGTENDWKTFMKTYFTISDDEISLSNKGTVDAFADLAEDVKNGDRDDILKKVGFLK